MLTAQIIFSQKLDCVIFLNLPDAMCVEFPLQRRADLRGLTQTGSDGATGTLLGCYWDATGTLQSGGAARAVETGGNNR